VEQARSPKATRLERGREDGEEAPAESGRAESREPAAKERPQKKQKYERPARAGREPGMTAVFLNVGRKHLVTPADIVGKIAGVTRLPAAVVGAIDIHQRHTLVDVATEEVETVLHKLDGIRIKGEVLKPVKAS